MEKRTGTYSKIYIQIVFAVQSRECLINSKWEEDLYKYITGVIHHKEQLLLAISGHRDHIHIAISIRPSCRLSDLVREIKKASTEYINKSRFVKGHFSWQEGYGAFSYSRWDADKLIAYVRNQKEHHRIRTFKEEYIDLLTTFEVEYKREHLFNWIDEDIAV